MSLSGKRILLIIAGGIAAYKSLDLIRRLRDQGALVRCVMTEAAKQFVTPLSVAALSGQALSDDLFSLQDDLGMAHISLSRQNDLIVVAPATADLLAKMASGQANDLASTTLLAADKPILVAPSMNALMWSHPATQTNIATLMSRGVRMVGPGAGDLACGEIGDGRMAEVAEILQSIATMFGQGPLTGRHALVTSGPTFEAIDPVRFIGNRSSGKQGHAIAAALARLGARVTLVSGPVSIADPSGVFVVKVESAEQMLSACLGALPADIAVCAAAVADWKAASIAEHKIKKAADQRPLTIELTPNPDILSVLSHHAQRPQIVVGFAAETSNLLENAEAKRKAKGCDLIVANNVAEGQGVFGGDHNQVWLVDARGTMSWPLMTKQQLAEKLADHLVEHFR